MEATRLRGVQLWTIGFLPPTGGISNDEFLQSHIPNRSSVMVSHRLPSLSQRSATLKLCQTWNQQTPVFLVILSRSFRGHGRNKNLFGHAWPLTIGIVRSRRDLANSPPESCMCQVLAKSDSPKRQQKGSAAMRHPRERCTCNLAAL